MKNFDPIETWLQSVEAALPHVLEYIFQHEVDCMIIGASLLELYPHFGIPTRATRRTGDLDLSVRVVFDIAEYENFRSFLVHQGYHCKEPEKRFRLFPKISSSRVPGYIDLLAHPAPGVDENRLREALGVGPDWRFESTDFARCAPVVLKAKLSLPNIFGFLFMKYVSWENEPLRRAKDLVDVVDVVQGLVEEGKHYELKALWDMLLKEHPEASSRLYKSLKKSADPNDIAINFEDYEQEFISRGYAQDELETLIPRYFQELLEALGYKNS